MALWDRLKDYALGKGGGGDVKRLEGLLTAQETRLLTSRERKELEALVAKHAPEGTGTLEQRARDIVNAARAGVEPAHPTPPSQAPAGPTMEPGPAAPASVHKAPTPPPGLRAPAPDWAIEVEEPGVGRPEGTMPAPGAEDYPPELMLEYDPETPGYGPGVREHVPGGGPRDVQFVRVWGAAGEGAWAAGCTNHTFKSYGPKHAPLPQGGFDVWVVTGRERHDSREEAEAALSAAATAAGRPGWVAAKGRATFEVGDVWRVSGNQPSLPFGVGTLVAVVAVNRKQVTVQAEGNDVAVAAPRDEAKAALEPELLVTPHVVMTSDLTHVETRAEAEALLEAAGGLGPQAWIASPVYVPNGTYAVVSSEGKSTVTVGEMSMDAMGYSPAPPDFPAGMNPQPIHMAKADIPPTTYSWESVGGHRRIIPNKRRWAHRDPMPSNITVSADLTRDDMLVIVGVDGDDQGSPREDRLCRRQGRARRGRVLLPLQQHGRGRRIRPNAREGEALLGFWHRSDSGAPRRQRRRRIAVNWRALVRRVAAGGTTDVSRVFEHLGFIGDRKGKGSHYPHTRASDGKMVAIIRDRRPYATGTLMDHIELAAKMSVEAFVRAAVEAGVLKNVDLPKDDEPEPAAEAAPTPLIADATRQALLTFSLDAFFDAQDQFPDVVLTEDGPPVALADGHLSVSWAFFDLNYAARQRALDASTHVAAVGAGDAYVEHLGDVGGVDVWRVDGTAIRDAVEVDFTMGGNAGRYDFVPVDEVWVEDGMNAEDTWATVVHEIIERNLMLNGALNYDDAHEKAAVAEGAYRAGADAHTKTTASAFLDAHEEFVATLDDDGIVVSAARPHPFRRVPRWIAPGVPIPPTEEEEQATLTGEGDIEGLLAEGRFDKLPTQSLLEYRFKPWGWEFLAWTETPEGKAWLTSQAGIDFEQAVTTTYGDSYAEPRLRRKPPTSKQQVKYKKRQWERYDNASDPHGPQLPLPFEDQSKTGAATAAVIVEATTVSFDDGSGGLGSMPIDKVRVEDPVIILEDILEDGIYVREDADGIVVDVTPGAPSVTVRVPGETVKPDGTIVIEPADLTLEPSEVTLRVHPQDPRIAAPRSIGSVAMPGDYDYRRNF